MPRRSITFHDLTLSGVVKRHDLIKANIFEPETNGLFCRLGHVPVTPVFPGKAPADSTAGVNGAMNGTRRKPHKADERGTPGDLNGPETEPTILELGVEYEMPPRRSPRGRASSESAPSRRIRI